MRIHITILVVLTLVLSIGAFASDPKAKDISAIDWNKAEVNYKAALNSTNFGVRTSAAAHIGEYRLSGAVRDLVAILRTDKIEKIRMAAASALMKIGSVEAKSAVKEASIYDGSDKVAKYCEELIKEEIKDFSIR